MIVMDLGIIVLWAKCYRKRKAPRMSRENVTSADRHWSHTSAEWKRDFFKWMSIDVKWWRSLFSLTAAVLKSNRYVKTLPFEGVWRHFNVTQRLRHASLANNCSSSPGKRRTESLPAKRFDMKMMLFTLKSFMVQWSHSRMWMQDDLVFKPFYGNQKVLMLPNIRRKIITNVWHLKKCC